MQVSFNIILTVIAALAVAVVVSFIATPLVKALAVRFGVMDIPKDNRRMQKKPVPRMGGLAIIAGFLVSALIFVPMQRNLKFMLLGSLIIIVLGVFDDKFSLPAKLKLVVQIVAALVAVYGGNVIDTISNPNLVSGSPYLSLGILSIPITVIWIVAITNAVNLIDGLDGLACGVSTICSISMLIIAVIFADPSVALLMAALAGGCIGFLPYNFNPAQIFMGDTGSTFLGYILAVVSIQGLFKFFTIISFAVPFLMLGLPIFDTCFAVIRRVAHGQSPMTPDRGHIHHKLIDMGLSQKQAVAVLYIISAILGLTAVVLATSGVLKAIILLVALLIAAFLARHLFIHYSLMDHRNVDPKKPAVKDSSTEIHETEGEDKKS